MGLARSKLSLLHLAKARLGLTDEDYRAILGRIGGVASSTELDAAGFAAVMDEFHRLGFESDSRREASFGGGPAGRRNMATPGEVRKIRALWAEVTDGAGTDAQLDRWIERRFRVSALRFVSRALARKIIGALTNWSMRKSG